MLVQCWAAVVDGGPTLKQHGSMARVAGLLAPKQRGRYTCAEKTQPKYPTKHINVCEKVTIHGWRQDSYFPFHIINTAVRHII